MKLLSWPLSYMVRRVWRKAGEAYLDCDAMSVSRVVLSCLTLFWNNPLSTSVIFVGYRIIFQQSSNKLQKHADIKMVSCSRQRLRPRGDLTAPITNSYLIPREEAAISLILGRVVGLTAGELNFL